MVAAALLAAAGAGVPGAAAQESAAEVLIESVSPDAPSSTSTLTVAGRVANTGDGDLSAPHVVLRFSPLPLTSRSEIPQVLSGTTDRTGTPVLETDRSLGDSLAPGQQSEFSLNVPIRDLGLPEDQAAVYAVFVEVLSGDQSVSSAGTVFPWFPRNAEFEPSQLAFVWPLVQPPAVAADELVTDPRLPAEFLPSGRLSRLLVIGQRNHVSWLIDMATLEAARDMADGYEVLTPQGPQPGDETAAAASFAQSVQQLLTRSRGTALPQYAIADDDAFQRAGLTPFVVRSASLPGVIRDDVARNAPATVTYVAPGGASDQPTLQTLVDAGVRRLLLGDQFFPPDPPTSYTPSGVATVSVGGTRVKALLSDRQLSKDLARPLTTAADRCRALQQFLADTAMITLELPAEPRRVVALPPMTWDPPEPWIDDLLSSLSSAPWLRLIGLNRVAHARAEPRTDIGYGAVAQQRELPPEYMARITHADDQIDRLSRVVNDPSGYGSTFTMALQRAGSAVWRDRPVERSQFMDTVERQLTQEQRSVRVVSSGTVTLAGDNGIVPLTIANDLDRSVTVGVQLATDNPIRLQYTPPDPVRIDAHEKAGIEVPVRVIGSQPMTVRIVLTDRDGGLYDDSGTIELRSTAASRIATIVVGVGGVTLVILVGLNLMRRRRGTPADAPQPREQLQDENV